jgi:hypothetical protein
MPKLPLSPVTVMALATDAPEEKVALPLTAPVSTACCHSCSV